ncbi:MAG: sortase [Chloracidobacterium sp.]|nr:sortase [Chloracidobacterium sp.]
MTNLALLIFGAMTLQMVTSPTITLDPTSANLITWRGRTLVAAHNYLAGSNFYDLAEGDIVEAVFTDGTKKYYAVWDRHIVTNVDDPVHWSKKYHQYTGWDRITLITCHPEIGVTDRYMIELVPVDLDPRDFAQMMKVDGK